MKHLSPKLVVPEINRIEFNRTHLNKTSWGYSKLINYIQGYAHYWRCSQGIAHIESPFWILIFVAQHLLMTEKRENKDDLQNFEENFNTLQSHISFEVSYFLFQSKCFHREIWRYSTNRTFSFGIFGTSGCILIFILHIFSSVTQWWALRFHNLLYLSQKRINIPYI